MKVKRSGIYRIKNIINDNVYIGSAIWIDRRFRQHKHLLRKNKHPSTHLQRAWNKYGEHNFIFEPIFHSFTKDCLIEFEQYFIDLYQPDYNLVKQANSRLGQKASEETKRKLSESHIGQKSWNKGTKTGKPAWNTGKKLHYDNYWKGKTMPIEIREKIRKTLTGRKTYNPNIASRIECIELGICFKSLGDAAKFLNKTHTSGISSCCRGVQPTAFGYTWKYC